MIDIERAAQYVLEKSRKGTSLNDDQRAADDEKLLAAYRDIIGKAVEFASHGNIELAQKVNARLRQHFGPCGDRGLGQDLEDIILGHIATGISPKTSETPCTIPNAEAYRGILTALAG